MFNVLCWVVLILSIISSICCLIGVIVEDKTSKRLQSLSSLAVQILYTYVLYQYMFIL